MQSCCFANITYYIFAVLVAVAVIVALSSLISCREVGLAHQNGTSENRDCFGPNRLETNMGQTYDRFGLKWHSNQ